MSILNKVEAMKAAGLTYEVYAVYDELRMNAKKAGHDAGRAYCSVTLPKEDRKMLCVAMAISEENEWCCLEVAPGFHVWSLSEDEAKRFPKGYCSFGDNYDKCTVFLRWDRATGKWLGKFDFDGEYVPLLGGYEQALKIARHFFTG